MYLLKELLPWSLGARIGSIINDIGQNLRLYANINVHVQRGGKHHERKFRSMVPLSIAGNLTIQKGRQISDNSGMNASMLDINLNLHNDAVATVAMNAPYYNKKEVPTLLQTMEGRKSSEVGLLYNLLRQYYALQNSGLTYDPEADYYNDGHVACTYKEIFGMTGPRKKFSLEFNEITMVQTRSSLDAPLVFWEGMTPEAASVIQIALSPLKGVKGIPLLADSPALCNYVNVNSVYGGGMKDAWENPHIIKTTIFSLVKYGRLYNAFDNALHMLTQTAVHFEYPVAEALPLAANDYTVELPEFDSFRFKEVFLTSGEAGGVRPSALKTFDMWSQSANSFWIYGAILRAAAEFSGVISFGTDFSFEDDHVAYAQQRGVNNALGIFMTFASATLGKELPIQLWGPRGASLPRYCKPVPLRRVGQLTNYDIQHEVGEGENKRYQLKPADDHRMTAFHSRLLFALGILPKSKVGMVSSKATIEVKIAKRADKCVSVIGEHVGPYMTMCRAFGWDATLRLATGEVIQSWADNGSRMVWTSHDLLELGTAPVQINSVRWRESNIDKQLFTPTDPDIYEFEMIVGEVGCTYDYMQPLTSGDLPNYSVRLPEHILSGSSNYKREDYSVEIMLAPPRSQAYHMSDFRLVNHISGRIAPPLADVVRHQIHAEIPEEGPSPEAPPG